MVASSPLSFNATPRSTSGSPAAAAHKTNPDLLQSNGVEQEIELEESEEEQKQDSLSLTERIPITELLDMLDRKYDLNLSSEQLDQAEQILTQQWFQKTEDLVGVDPQTLYFLNLPPALRDAMLKVIQKHTDSRESPLFIRRAVPVFLRGQSFGPYGGTTSGVDLKTEVRAAESKLREAAEAARAAAAAAAAKVPQMKKSTDSKSSTDKESTDEKEQTPEPPKLQQAKKPIPPKSKAKKLFPSRPGCGMPVGRCVVAQELGAPASAASPNAAADERESLVTLSSCQHTFCRGCLRALVLQRVAQKKALGITCPEQSGCSVELDPSVDIQGILSPAEFESYLEATLLAFVETDQLSVSCPTCEAIFSVEPFKGYDGPVPENELDLDDNPITREGWLHYLEFRIRCRSCQTVFCAECETTPYHKGLTCLGWEEYQNLAHCRFCNNRLKEDNTLKVPPSPAMEDVCTDEECLEKMQKSCLKSLECGCPCFGIRDERECPPCLRHDLEEDISEEYCAICYVEELQQAPCIQMTGKCQHFFHHDCVLEKLEARWPGARISFDFRCCPVDKQELTHPALAPVLPDILKLQRRVNLMALERLHYEQKHKDACLKTKGDDFYGQPLAYALHEFLFYLCHECHRPYFAGGYQCQEADAPFDPKELICPACQPHSVDDCPVHGKDWLAFKCRFCCNIGQWLCWSNTHFCDKCHKSGTWQKLVTFRTGVNKKAIWEYPQCTDLVPQVEAIRKDKSLTEEQKMEKLQTLQSNPATCPTGLKHPPNGFEFGLGCSMCADRESAAIKLDDDEKGSDLEDELELDEEARMELEDEDLNHPRGTHRFMTRDLTRFGPQGRKFKWMRDFDTGGVLYWLGCSAGRGDWENPVNRGLVRVTASSTMDDSEPPKAAVGRSVVRCVTRPEPQSSFTVELLGLELAPTHYTLRHYSTWDIEALRNWKFEGSRDGVSWTLLRNHSNDAALRHKGASHTWELPAAPKGEHFTFFRVYQTGPNSNNNHYLALSGMELYGRLRVRTDPVAERAINAAAVVYERQGGRRGRELAELEVKGDPVQDNRVVMEDGKVWTWVKDFHYNSDFDENGLFFWLGRDLGRSWRWKNPAAEAPRWVEARCSQPATNPASAPAWAICGRETVRCVSAALPNMWMSVELLHGARFYPSKYTLRHYSSWNTECLRNWRFEASNDGVNWVTLMTHVEDARLNGKGSTASWDLPALPPGGPWSSFRIFMTGTNSNHKYFLACSGLELYGRLFEAEDRPLTSFGGAEIAAAAALPPVAPVRQAGLEQAGQMQLAWSGRDFDNQGLFHMLGTDFGRSPVWRNPGDMGRVSVIWSSLVSQPPSAPATSILGKATVRCVSDPKPNSWFQVNLNDCAIAPTHYSLRHYSTWDTEALRTWKLEGSADGRNWILLSAHDQDASLHGKGSTHTWALPRQAGGQRFLRYFRLQQTGSNSNGNYFLACSGFELYGTVLVQGVPPIPAVPSGVAQAGSPLGGGLHPQQAALPFGMSAAEYQQILDADMQILRRRPGWGEILPGIDLAPLRPKQWDPRDFCRGGAVFYFGSEQWTRPFQNPGQSGKLVVDSSPLAQQPPSSPAWSITGREAVRCVTHPVPNAFFSVDFRRYAIRPTHYALRHYSSFDTEALRNWVLEGSNNGKKWTVLRAHKDDRALHKKGMTHLWTLPKIKKSYRIFRVRITGNNSNGHIFLALSGFEIYGKLAVAKKKA